MWKLITGFHPFGNVTYNLALVVRILEGERPQIDSEMPKEFVQFDMYKGVLNLDELFSKLNYTQAKHPSN
ncbi:2700_t:CDS:2, partial [Dentiscutata erythropus]